MRRVQTKLETRRSDRIPISVPARICTSQQAKPIVAFAKVVNKHGAKFECDQCLSMNQEVWIDLLSGGTVKGRVVWSPSRPRHNGNFEFAIEFDDPVNLFRVPSPPESWEKG